MSLTICKFETGDMRMKPWHVLVKATIQGVKIQGTVTCRTSNEKSARRLACMTFINQLRRAGIWTHSDEIDEPYEVEVEGPKDKKTGKPTKKKETKYKKVTRYHAPEWSHVEVIDILEPNSRDLTFPMAELEEAALYASGGPAITSRKKRRTTGEVALKTREKKMDTVAKKEKQQEKQARAEANKQSKDELMKVVEAHFTGEDAKIIKVAAGELDQTYQRVRYALFQIKDKGYNGAEYTLIQTEIDDSKAFRLKKKGK
ncbi:hypothetical protein LCGC14_1854780 [marine sediment metagenome]|uniref:Uncharacterized protein n=1 Tax=marine sediment metagenome TaxID=412755 RepID=A0A0F9INV4_9ZZZZ